MIRTVAELGTRLAQVRAAKPGGRVALVSTIGALHDGHVELIRAAREQADVVVVSLFVNPLRFATDAEAAAYPRSPEQDAALLADLRVDVVFAPHETELLPEGRRTTRIAAGDAGLRYEGRVRPFYFDGLLTVEAKLFHLVRPDVSVYGDRDRQRSFLVARMARDLFFDVEVSRVETVRETDGVPCSTRLGALDAADRAAAALLPRALEAAAANADRDVDACIAAAQSALMGESRIRLEYLSVVDPTSFLPVDEGHRGPALALIAATVGGHRFIDNAEIFLG